MNSQQPLLLIIDDEVAILETLQGALQDEGYRVQTLPDGSKVLDAIGKSIPDLVLLDIFLPHHNGIALLENIKREYPSQQVMMISGFGNIQMALEATRKGALDFIEKPLSLFDILPKIEFIKHKKRTPEQPLPESEAVSFGIIGRSFLFKELIGQMEHLAKLPFPTLIYGAHGVGKTLFANYIHSRSGDADMPCITIQCNELTRLAQDCVQDSGTVILSHIEKLAPTEQKMLIEILNKKTLRIIATTTQPLAHHALRKTFDPMLFYKLNIIPIEIPSLEKRPFDIPLLIEHFLSQANAIHQKSIILTPSGTRYLRNHAWKENVRELKQCIFTLVAHMDSFAIIDGEDLDQFFQPLYELNKTLSSIN